MKYLLQGKYVLENTLDLSDLTLNHLYYLDFVSNNTTYARIQYRSEGLYYGATVVYDTAWINSAYRTIVVEKSQYVEDALYTCLTSTNLLTESHEDFMTSKLTLYRNTGESIRVDKTNYLTNATVLSGNLRESINVSNLEITIEYDGYPKFNYLYCNITDRYYFIDDIIILSHGLFQLICRCDVLMSFKDDILNTKAKIDRCEYALYQNKDLVDPMVELEADETIGYLDNNLTTAQKTIADKLNDTISGGEFVLICNS